MVVNKILEYIFSAPSNVTILRVLNERNTGISGREVKRLTGLSLRTVQLSLVNLENTGIVKKLPGKRENLYLIDREKFLSKHLIENIYITEKLFLKDALNVIKKKISKYCESVILFGSAARGDEHIESDLDLCIVYMGKPGIIEDAVSELRTTLYKKYNITLAPFYQSLSNFRKSGVKGKSPLNNIIKEGKVISGKSVRELLNG